MPPLKNEKIALLLIDVQQGFTDPRWGVRNNPEAEKNIITLVNDFRKRGLPIIHVQHLSTEETSPLRPGQPGAEFLEETQPCLGESIFQKTVNSAFIGTKLEDHLRARSIQSLVMVGFTTDHCVSTTARMASNFGFDVVIVSDATIAFNRQGLSTVYAADLVHEVSLASLKGEFADIVNTSDIINNEERELETP